MELPYISVSYYIFTYKHVTLTWLPVTPTMTINFDILKTELNCKCRFVGIDRK